MKNVIKRAKLVKYICTYSSIAMAAKKSNAEKRSTR